VKSSCFSGLSNQQLRGFVNGGHADDGCLASERVYGLVSRAHGNDREAPSCHHLHVDDGDVHLDHECVDADV